MILKIKVFLNEGYSVIYSVHEVTKKTLLVTQIIRLDVGSWDQSLLASSISIVQ